MPYTPTPLGGQSADRFSVLGTAVWLWLPAVAAPETGPAEAEINAGTILQCAAQDITGFSVSSTFTNTPDLCNTIDGKVFDGSTVDDSSMTFYNARTAVDAKAFFTALQVGFILHAPYGLPETGGETRPGDLWPVTVGSVTSLPMMRGASATRVDFAPGSPLQGFDIPVPAV